MKKFNAPRGEIVIYKASDGSIQLDVKLQEETVWLNLNQISLLLQKDKSVVSRHINNIFNEGELDRNPTVAKFATVQVEGNRQIQREIEYYNLDVIISVGYRVKSKRGTQFRIGLRPASAYRNCNPRAEARSYFFHTKLFEAQI